MLVGVKTDAFGRTANALARALADCGFEKARRRIDGKRRYLWAREAQPNPVNPT
jgi:hypothetical protein